jgi:hypothetical protein
VKLIQASEATMSIDQVAEIGIGEFAGQGASSSLLPKNVRFLGEAPTVTEDVSRPSTGMCEFEVVTGNAAYREGERFYLTPAQARRAYHLVQHG